MSNQSVSLVDQHKSEILARIAKGEPLSSIAKVLGYADHSGISHRLNDDKDYQLAMRAGIIGKLEKREKELELADTNVTVTRSDRLLNHARWWAEKLDPQRFGKNEQVQGLTIQVIIADPTHAIEGEHRTDVMSNIHTLSDHTK